VRAFEALLQERIPTLPPLHLISTRHSEPVLLSGDLIAPMASSFTTPHTVTPMTLLLSNGRYDLMITNSGGGYSGWKGREISRWRRTRPAMPWEPSAISMIRKGIVSGQPLSPGRRQA